VFARQTSRRTSLARFTAHEQGSSALEFALVCPVFFMMLFGLFEFGWALHCGASVRAAVTKEIRLLIASSDTTQAQFETAVKEELAGTPGAAVAITFAPEMIGTTAATRISWTYDYQVLFPLLPNVKMAFGSSTLVPKPQ
jgi:Flp pilus assembly protein TadG